MKYPITDTNAIRCRLVEDLPALAAARLDGERDPDRIEAILFEELDRAFTDLGWPGAES